jgi:molybdopterin converting factor small subunit
MTKQIECRYVAHISMATRKMKEQVVTSAESMAELIDQLDERYHGFAELLRDSKTGKLRLQAMIYYSDKGEIPVTVIDLDLPIKDGGTVTFW